MAAAVCATAELELYSPVARRDDASETLSARTSGNDFNWLCKAPALSMEEAKPFAEPSVTDALPVGALAPVSLRPLGSPTLCGWTSIFRMSNVLSCLV